MDLFPTQINGGESPVSSVIFDCANWPARLPCYTYVFYICRFYLWSESLDHTYTDPSHIHCMTTNISHGSADHTEIWTRNISRWFDILVLVADLKEEILHYYYLMLQTDGNGFDLCTCIWLKLIQIRSNLISPESIRNRVKHFVHTRMK